MINYWNQMTPYQKAKLIAPCDKRTQKSGMPRTCAICLGAVEAGETYKQKSGSAKRIAHTDCVKWQMKPENRKKTKKPQGAQGSQTPVLSMIRNKAGVPESNFIDVDAHTLSLIPDFKTASETKAAMIGLMAGIRYGYNQSRRQTSQPAAAVPPIKVYK